MDQARDGAQDSVNLSPIGPPSSPSMVPAGDDEIWREDAVLAGIDTAGLDLISLDVFDTLLLRRCGPPEAVFPLVAQAARACGALDGAITDYAFTLLRREAEARARRDLIPAAGRADITLDDVYCNLRLPGSDTAALARIERETERRMTVANPYVAGFLRHLRRCGMPVMLLSDMYLSASDIEALLNTAGLPRGAAYDRLYVSCEQGAVKSGGGLFRRMLADRPSADPARVLHIGDNVMADQAGAQAAGVQAVLYAPPPHWTTLTGREGRLGVPQQGPLAPLRGMTARAGAGTHDRFWFDFGSLVMGPIAVHFAEWVLRHTAERGVRRIAPLMREGGLLSELMVAQARRLGLDMDIRPLHVSRGALLLPGLEGFGAAELEAISADSVYRTVGDLAGLLGLGPLPDSLAGQAGVPLIDLLGAHRRDGSGAFAALRDWLLDPARQAAVRARIGHARGLAGDYLRQELGEDGPVALVDIGARGTMFERIARAGGGRHDLHGYLFYATPEALHRMAAGMRIHTYMPLTAETIERARIIYRSPQFLELLLNGEAETTTGYRRAEDGQSVPVTEPAAVPDWQRAALRAGYAGIRRYAGLCESLGVGWGQEADPAAVLGILFRAVHLPTPEEAERLGALVYDLNDATRATQTLCGAGARHRLAALCRTVRPAMRLSVALQTRPSEVPWPQGALTLECPGHLEDMIDGARGDFGHRAICRQIIDMVQAAGAGRLVVCAAGGRGGMGPTFIGAAREAGLGLAGYADLLVPAQGDAFEGVPVLPLAAAAREDCRFAAVVSVGYGSAILKALREGMHGDSRPLHCFWFDGTEFRTTVIADGRDDREESL